MTSLIRGATVVDGLGHDPIRTDLAVRDGRIAAIGDVGKDAPEIIDAGGLPLIAGHHRPAHALRRAGHLGPELVAIALARGHNRDHGQGALFPGIRAPKLTL